MKTDKEWAGESYIDEVNKVGILKFIRAVQADALRHAARICLSNHNAYNSDADCEMLQAEADKLEGK